MHQINFWEQLLFGVSLSAFPNPKVTKNVVANKNITAVNLCRMLCLAKKMIGTSVRRIQSPSTAGHATGYKTLVST